VFQKTIIQSDRNVVWKLRKAGVQNGGTRTPQHIGCTVRKRGGGKRPQLNFLEKNQKIKIGKHNYGNGGVTFKSRVGRDVVWESPSWSIDSGEILKSGDAAERLLNWKNNIIELHSNPYRSAPALEHSSRSSNNFIMVVSILEVLFSPFASGIGVFLGLSPLHRLGLLESSS